MQTENDTELAAWFEEVDKDLTLCDEVWQCSFQK